MFEGERLGKQQVVLQMYVLMQIGLEFGEQGVQYPVGVAGAIRRREIVAQAAQFVQEFTGGIMLGFHDPDGVGRRLKGRNSSRLFVVAYPAKLL